jgi:hypothetical protein
MDVDGGQEENNTVDESREIDDASDDDNSDERPQTPEAPRFTREQIPQELVKKLAPKATNSNSRHGQYHCKYCMDDETTETCCFCACRVCFTQHGRSSTILCDLCDGEYHISCLSPPLSEIPSFDWYCPTCTEAIVKALDEPTSRTALSKKGGKLKLGKSLSKVPVKKGATKAKAKLALKQKKSAYSAMQPRTASGRFAPKPKLDEKLEILPVKRGPGRPPKSASKTSPNKKRISNTIEKVESSFTPGRGILNASSQQRSRSGRVVKRKAAYDEREEGAQLLKVPKIFMEDIVSDDGNDVATKVGPSAAATLAANTAISLSKEESTVTTNKSFDIGDQIIGNPDVLDQPSSNSSPMLGYVKASLVLPEEDAMSDKPSSSLKYPRRKPGARECMQISRRFGSGIIPQNYMDILIVSLVSFQIIKSAN